MDKNKIKVVMLNETGLYRLFTGNAHLKNKYANEKAKVVKLLSEEGYFEIEFPDGMKTAACMDEIEIIYEGEVTDKKAITDSGRRQEYQTGSMREPSSGKGRYDLISPHALKRLAQRYEIGLEKYSERNWEKGQPISRCYDSAVRHMNQYMMGHTDEDHLAAAVFNIFAIMHFEETKPEMQDLPNRLK